jgi:hypothetical protein
MKKPLSLFFALVLLIIQWPHWHSHEQGPGFQIEQAGCHDQLHESCDRCDWNRSLSALEVSLLNKNFTLHTYAQTWEADLRPAAVKEATSWILGRAPPCI